MSYSISVYKQYFNFSAAHFMIFQDGSREYLHGHNYRVKVKLLGHKLYDDMLMDFLSIKPLIRQICDSMDHKLILPRDNPYLLHERVGEQIWLRVGKMPTVTNSATNEKVAKFALPVEDVLILPILNSSVEHIANYFLDLLVEKVKLSYPHIFKSLNQIQVEVEESPGQSAMVEKSI